MDVPIAVIADAANSSGEGKLNILGIFDTVFTDGFPAIHPRCVLVLRFRPALVDAGTITTLQVRFQDVDGAQAIWTIESQLTIPDGPTMPTIDNTLALTGLPLPHEGEYAFTILVGGEEKAIVPLYARSMTPGGE